MIRERPPAPALTRPNGGRYCSCPYRKMRTPARYLLALTLVATALCADRAQAEAPRADQAVPSRGLVDRLTDGFRRTVTTTPLVRQRCPLVPAVRSPRPWPVRPAAATVQPVNPACLPQPPPAL